MAETPDKTEVTVIGAGPAGLVSAMLLGRAGIDVHVFDAAARCRTFPPVRTS